jgi:uncharacterized membrane protein YraQ (UPF0718 family)
LAQYFDISGNKELLEVKMNSPSLALRRPGQWISVLNDRLIVLIVVLLASLFVLDKSQALATLIFTAEALIHIAPFFILAIAFAAYAKASGLDQLIARAFSLNPPLAIAAGALAGALSPFCSCGVVPIIAGMLASGVPLAPVMAFCIASPVMDPEMFILTAAGINVQFAVAKTLTAIGMGLLAGYAVLGLQRLGYLRQPLRETTGCGCGQPAFDPRAPLRISWRIWREPAERTDFIRQSSTNGFFLAKWMTLAFVIESLMVAYLPAETVAQFVGMDNWMAIPMASIIGVPAYMNGYAAIPLISGFLDLGMAPGAALSFVTAGAVSSIPAALAVYALVRRPVFCVYLALGLLGSMISGYGYNLIVLM